MSPPTSRNSTKPRPPATGAPARAGARRHGHAGHRRHGARRRRESKAPGAPRGRDRDPRRLCPVPQCLVTWRPSDASSSAARGVGPGTWRGLLLGARGLLVSFWSMRRPSASPAFSARGCRDEESARPVRRNSIESATTGASRTSSLWASIVAPEVHDGDLVMNPPGLRAIGERGPEHAGLHQHRHGLRDQGVEGPGRGARARVVAALASCPVIAFEDARRACGAGVSR